MESYNLISFSGVFLLIGCAWLFSANRKAVNWRTVVCGTALQFFIGVFVFLIPAGTKLFLFLNTIVLKVLESAGAGTRFLFGRLALPPGTSNAMGESSLGFFLAFQALPTIIFFAALLELLYHVNILPRLIRIFSSLFAKTMKISGAESLATASNIFVGVESSLVVKPYLQEMTKSELCTILTAGMATIASSVMALYVFILQGRFPMIAGHLISASILSAPAAIVFSKILFPETETPLTSGEAVAFHYEESGNGIEAIIRGTNNGVKLVVGITALLLSFLGLVELANLILSSIGGYFNQLIGLSIDWSLTGLLGYVFYPFTLMIGIPPADALAISKIIGERMVITEVGSYQDLANLIQAGTLKHPRSIIITTYALCGFAHFASLAIFVGGAAALAPTRIKDLSRLGFRALIAATFACLLTASVAGTFFTSQSLLMNTLP